MNKFVVSACVVALCGVSTASAQDWTRPASFGGITLEGGFSPDPHRVNLTAGGSIAASDRFTNCRGYIADAPDYSVSFSDPLLPLTFTVDSDVDTTLIINDPSGDWYCDDDGAEEPLNPAVRFESPSSGRYDIWVGTYSQGSGEAATLFISELGEHTRESAGMGRITANTGSSSGRITANTGSSSFVDISERADINASLNGGFLPDPSRYTVMAGGNVDLSSAIVGGSDCPGYANVAPTIELDYSGSSTLHFYTEGDTDTTLAINAPNGEWFCNDDGATSLNAGLSLSNGSGIYDIYVGRFSSGRDAVTLSVSEIAIDY